MPQISLHCSRRARDHIGSPHKPLHCRHRSESDSRALPTRFDQHAVSESPGSNVSLRFTNTHASIIIKPHRMQHKADHTTDLSTERHCRTATPTMQPNYSIERNFRLTYTTDRIAERPRRSYDRITDTEPNSQQTASQSGHAEHTTELSIPTDRIT